MYLGREHQFCTNVFLQTFNKNAFCSDMLSILDKKCSGRSSCQFAVNSLVFETKPCPIELRSYLQARYTCLPGKLFQDGICCHMLAYVIK